MAKKSKQPVKKARAKRAATKKIVAKSKKSAPKRAKKITKKNSKKIAAKRASNRRVYRRYETKNLWVTELSGDYQFVVPAADLSEGGIFLKRRMKTVGETSRLRLNLGSAGTLEVSALPVYDRVSESSYGTGYRFTELSTSQAKSLRSFLRNLD